VLPSHFGPRYHSHHPIISLPTIYSSSPLCYLPLLSPDITLSTLLSVSPQCTVLHPSVTFPFGPRYHTQHPIMSLPTIYSSSFLCYIPFWHQISFSGHYYESTHNIQFLIPVLPSTFGPRYHSQHPIISLPTTYSSSPLSYLTILAPDITLSTLL